MKLLKSYLKEMKIASRGFYFYVEILVAVLVLMVLMMVVKPWPDGHKDEYIFNDMSKSIEDYMIKRDINAKKVVKGEDAKLKLKPGSFTLYDKETGENKTYDFPEKETITVKTLDKINSKTGKKLGTVYLMPDKDSMLRMANKTGKMGAVITVDDTGNASYEYISQGYETKRFENILYILHTYDVETMDELKSHHEVSEIGTVERLNTREAVVPVYVTFACTLMGFFIVCAYIFLDKNENVIKAFLVTPGTLTTYLLSKILVILTVVFLSASIVVLPVAGMKPNYPLFYLLLLSASFGFCAFGLFVASFYENMGKAFGVLYLIMIALMLPVIPYYVGSFDPLWMHFLPTWPILMSFKSIVEGQCKWSFVLPTILGCLVIGFVFLVLSKKSFRKTITM